MKKIVIVMLGILLIPSAPWLATTQVDLESIRAQFREVAKLQELTRNLPKLDQANNEQRALWRQANDATRALTHKPIDQVLAAIDQSIHGKDELEIIGALSVYMFLIVLHRAVPDIRYKPLLLDMLANDDFSSEIYTDTVAGFLHFYPSRETMLAYMDAAKRAPDARNRDEFLEATAGLLNIELNYTLSDPTPERKRKALAAFETWYEKNKNTVRFDSKGEPHFSGGPGEWKPPKLSSADKARIKADPVCVLRLFETIQASQDPKPGEVQELNARCGQALLGEKRATALASALEGAKNGSAPSLEQQFSMSSAAVDYPTVSAALTAVAYVASADPIEPKAKELAVRILDDFGEDLQEILKDEPASVRKKVLELAEETAP